MSLEHDVKDFTEMFHTLNAGTQHPRVIAIVVASYIEDYLARLVQTRLPGLTHKKDDETKKKLFANSGPLSTNGANVEMARALGLIDNQLKKELITISRIRNRFAHNVKINDFNHPEIVKLCKDLHYHKDANISYFDNMHGGIKSFCISSMRVASILNNMVLKHAINKERVEQLISDNNDAGHEYIVDAFRLLSSMMATVSRKS